MPEIVVRVSRSNKRKLALWFGVLACLSPAHAQVPSTYQDLYTQLSGYLQTFAGQISAGWDGSTWPVTFTGQLKTASTSTPTNALFNPAYYTQQVLPELNQLKALGATGVMICVDFPIAFQGFYPTSPSTYQSYINFYSQLASDIHARGMKLIVANDVFFANGTGSFNVAGFYSGLSMAQFNADRAQMAVAIAQAMNPDYMTVVAEPDTEAGETGFSALNTISGSMAELTGITGALRQAGLTGVRVGAGIGSWQNSWQSWVQAFATAGINYFDLHIIPVNRTFLTGTPAQVDYINSFGLPVAMSQVWLEKMRDSEVGLTSYNQMEGRDAFSFWAPLDTQFLQEMVQFSNWKHLAFFTPFWTEYFHVYLPYNNTTGIMSQPQMITLVENASNTAIAAGIFTSTGQAYGAAIAPPQTTAPSVPTGVAAIPYTRVYITWNPSTDNRAVAGYLLYRNGVPLVSTANLYYYDANITPSTNYTYTVAAFNANVMSGQSMPVTITTKP